MALRIAEPAAMSAAIVGQAARRSIGGHFQQEVDLLAASPHCSSYITGEIVPIVGGYSGS